MRYFLRLSFDGTSYHGWQVQKNAHTVQAELNNALKTLFRKDIETLGCGRTDTGVHAKKFFVHFDFDEINDLNAVVHQLNSILPPSIAIHSVFIVDEKSHARFSATSRTYQYSLYHSKNPFLRDRSYYFPGQLDVVKMNEISENLKKHSDFSAFSKSRTQTLTNICLITFAKWERSGDELIFTITADRFLRNMVRAIVGTLLNIGINKISESEFNQILLSLNRSEAGFSVPAHGLFLTDITYPFPVY
jgi:tRNA pseudouridine38-40 synthase